MTAKEGEIRQLIDAACQAPVGSIQRQKSLTQLIRLIAPQLWRDSSPDYADALQQTWIYFCRNLCESATGERYDSDRATVVTWLNYYLKKRLQTYFHRARVQQSRQVGETLQGDGERGTAVVERIAAPADIPPILEAVRRWATTDAAAELRKVHIAGHPEVTCQLIILRRLPPEQSWKDLSHEWGIAIPTLSSFYQRQCLPRLRNFGKAEGYL